MNTATALTALFVVEMSIGNSHGSNGNGNRYANFHEKWNGNGLMGIGGNENSTFSHFQLEEENQPVSGATSASLGTSVDSDTLDCHSSLAKKRRLFDFKALCGPEDDQQLSHNELAEYVNLNENGSGKKWE